MALSLARTEKGIQCEYWKIISAQEDFLTDTTRSILGLYVDRTHRDADPKGFLDRKSLEIPNADIQKEVDKLTDTMKGEPLENVLKTAQYKKWKEPKMEQHPTGEKNEDGTPIMESVDTNPFSSSTDI
jgi:hypothetical protein